MIYNIARYFYLKKGEITVKGQIKKIFATALGIAMTLSMSVVPTLAFDRMPEYTDSNANSENATYSITISDTTPDKSKAGHIYGAYQIMKGNVNGTDGSFIMSDIDWGSGIDASKLTGEYAGLTAKAAAKKLAGDATQEVETEAATAFAQQIVKDEALTAPAGTVSKSPYKITELKPGYYLILDEWNPDDQKGTQPDASTAFILKVVGDTTVAPKSDIPTVEKKVLDTNDTAQAVPAADLNAAWKDSADYDAYANDKVPFKLTATLPSDNSAHHGFSDYKSYKLVFNDTFEAGLSSPSKNIAEYDIYVGTHKLTEEEKTTVGARVATSANGFNLTIANVKALTGANAPVAGGTVIRSPGIGGTSATGANAPVAGGTVTVIYHLTLDKATAVIGSKGQANKVNLTFSNNPNVNCERDTGLTPTDTVRVFTYKVDVDKIDEGQKPLEGAAFKLEKKNPDGSFKTVIENIGNVGTDKTKFEITGIDDGTYRITETATPRGYNSIKPVTFTVNATHQETADDPQLETLTVTDVKMDTLLGDTKSNAPVFTADKTSGSAATKVVNEKGLVLPKTGDMGTMIFYIAGAGLIAGSIIALKRRKNAHSAKSTTRA